MGNLTTEQLVQYDSKIKEYIQQQLSGYESTISDLTSIIDEQQTKIEELESLLRDSNSGQVDPPSQMSIMSTTPQLRSLSLGDPGSGISIRSISPDPESLVVQEDIQEDYIVYDRVISPNEEAEYKNIVVTTDNKSNRIFFSMWHTFDNRDLMSKSISVVWINADGNKGETACGDIQLIGDRLYFSWDVPGACTNHAGTIRYAIRIVDDDYAWNTIPAEIECVQGLMDSEWDEMPDAIDGVDWAEWLESQYRALISILTEDQYNALEEKEEMLYVVKMNDGIKVNLYLGTKFINTIFWESLP